jgi:L,D-transpeptidase catalytic domain
MRAPTILALLTIILLSSVIPTVSADETCMSCPSAVEATPEAISAYPTPQVQQIYADEALLYDRVYRKVTQSVDILDAPGGTPTMTLGLGFNFVTVESSNENFVQISHQSWIPAQNLLEAVPSSFAGVRIEEELPYPMAWLLVNVVPSRTPGSEPTSGDLAMLRYTKVNLYSYVEIDEWRWYQIGIDQWVHQTQIAKYIPVTRPSEVDTERWISVDLYEQVAVAYEGETPVFTTLISSGLSEWPTNEGLFHVYVRYPRTLMSGAEGKPDFYYLEEVPWTMYFDGDIGLHGTYWHDGFGYRRSHGCVNLSITDSHWLYQWASTEFDFTVDSDLGPAVYVYSSGTYQ